MSLSSLQMLAPQVHRELCEKLNEMITLVASFARSEVR
jgi:hypothetical protein